MATLTNEQIEQKKQQLKQLAEEVKQLHDELVEAGAIELSEDDLDKAAGGIDFPNPQGHQYHDPQRYFYKDDTVYLK